MLSDVTFGQYYPAVSPVHKMNPAIKILFLVAYIVAIFLIKNFYGLALMVVATLFITFVSKIPLKSVLKSIKGILFIIILTFIINVFFNTSGKRTLLFSIWKIKIYKESLIFAVFMALRLAMLVIGSSLLTLTTSPVELTDGIEVVLFPLKIVRFPVHELALIMSIALRFIPTLMEETDRIMSAQKARGAQFDEGNIFKRIKSLVPILIPLLISSFRRAEELGDAMDSRCYTGSKGRTKYKKMTIKIKDVIGVLFFAALIAGCVLLNFYFPHII